MALPAPRRLPGLRALFALLLAGAFLGAGLAVWFVHAPWLRGRMEEETGNLVREALDGAVRSREEDLAQTEAVVRAAAVHLVERTRRDLEDLPFELAAGDPAATRALVASQTTALGETAADNAGILAREIRRRTEARLARLEDALRARQAEAARRTAASLAASSTLLVLGLFAALLGLHGFFLGRAALVPVNRIAAGVERLAAGDLSHRVEESGSREVADLAAGVNRMAGALGRATSEVRALNEDLERRVREKSAALVRAETLASIGTLAGGVAHDFNNLLGGIQGTAAEAREDARDEATREALDLIERTARRGCAVTENLLQFARPREPRVEAVDAAAVLRDAAALVEPEAARRGVALEVRAGAVPPFPADPAELHQVALNLLANAVALTPPGGRVEASTGTEGAEFVLRVRDTGPGIRPEHLPRLFEPFFTTRGSEGTGLGLAVSHGIVRAHGGSIEGANAQGGGAVFTVRLPLRRPAGGAA